MALYFRAVTLSLLLSWTGLAAEMVVGPNTVWRPGKQSIQGIMQKCGSFHSSELNACFLKEMRAKGASSEAVAFSRTLYENSNGLIGFLRRFRKAGKVDTAYVEYVFRANENLACYLVNGTPALIDVDNFKLLAMDSLENDSRYKALEARYPKLSIWPGDRFTGREPLVQTLPQAGQRFIVSYWLQNGCHACERIGEVQFAFDFDRAGKLLGTRLISVEAGAPAKQ